MPVLNGAQIRSRNGGAILDFTDGSRLNILPFSSVQFREKGNPRALDTFEFDAGVVGPAALGEPLQKGIHRLIGSPRPRGWNNQIRNEAAFNVTYLAMRKLVREAQPLPIAGNGLKWDATAHGGLAFGTVFNYVNGGATLRVGNALAGAPGLKSPGTEKQDRGDEPGEDDVGEHRRPSLMKIAPDLRFRLLDEVSNGGSQLFERHRPCIVRPALHLQVLVGLAQRIGDAAGLLAQLPRCA